MRRRFVGVSQSTMQLNGTSDASRPVTSTRSSCSRPMRWAVCAASGRDGAPPSQRTRSRSCVARSFTTPTSRTRSGNGPTRSVAMRNASPSSVARRSRSASSAGLKRSTCPTAAWTPASRTAAMIADASSEVAASGFSTRMCTPARASSQATSRCSSVGHRDDREVRAAALEQLADGREDRVTVRNGAVSVASGSTAPANATRGEDCSSRAWWRPIMPRPRTAPRSGAGTAGAAATGG